MSKPVLKPVSKRSTGYDTPRNDQQKGPSARSRSLEAVKYVTSMVTCCPTLDPGLYVLARRVVRKGLVRRIDILDRFYCLGFLATEYTSVTSNLKFSFPLLLVAASKDRPERFIDL
jgi:hypothetical protein